MTSMIIVAAVRCGLKGTLRRLHQIAEAHGAERVEAEVFRCRRCKQTWTVDDISCGADLDKISCSSCYSSTVEISRVKVTHLEPKDFT